MKACPFCGSNNVSVLTENNDSDLDVYAYCASCGARGGASNVNTLFQPADEVIASLSAAMEEAEEVWDMRK